MKESIKFNSHGRTIRQLAGRKGGRRRVKKGFATNTKLASCAGKKGMENRWKNKPKKEVVVKQHKYKNKFEARIGSLLSDDGVNFTYETEKINYALYLNYVPDFIINKKDGSKIYIETKGNGRSFDASVRRKMVAVKKQHPELDIRIVFWADSKFGARRKDGSRRTQSEWADKNGFKYAIGKIPYEWIE